MYCSRLVFTIVAAMKLLMKIGKELLEKYHRNECTTEESDAVEAWLFSGDSDEALQLPLNESKAAHKAEMWTEIAKILPAHIPLHNVPQPAPILVPVPVSVSIPAQVPAEKRIFKNTFWSGAIAASLIIGIVGIASYQLITVDLPVTALMNINNTSLENVRHIESSGYNISVGTNTSARIDNLTGAVDLSGSMLICPKKDISLSFEGSTEKIIFKKGQTYILLKGKDGKDKILIVSRQNLMDLPPVLQKQIMHEFNI